MVIFFSLTLMGVLLDAEGVAFGSRESSVWWGQLIAVAEARWAVLGLQWQCLGKIM